MPGATETLAGAAGPVAAPTDYVSEVPDQVRQFLPERPATLGADGHGFSDTWAATRHWFHIDVHSVVVRAPQLLADESQVDGSAARKAAERHRLLDVTTGNACGDS